MDKVKAYLHRSATGGGLRGVRVGDVLGAVTWAADPYPALGDFWQYPEGQYMDSPRPLIEFVDNTAIYAEYMDGDIEDFRIVFADSPRSGYIFDFIAQFAHEIFWEDMTSWDLASYDFGGRQVAAVYGDIGNVIKVQDGTPAMTVPVKPYLYRPAIEELRGVAVGDVLDVVTWADTPTGAGFTYSLVGGREVTFLTFGDSTRIYTKTEENLGLTYYRVMFESTILATNVGNPPTAWSSSSFDFGGRTVASINDASIQNVIKVQDGTPAIMAPLTAYFKKED